MRFDGLVRGRVVDNIDLIEVKTPKTVTDDSELLCSF